MHFNAFFRHAASVRMANLAQLVNVIAPDGRPRRTTCCSRPRTTRSSCTPGRPGPSRSTRSGAATPTARADRRQLRAGESDGARRASARSTSRRPSTRHAAAVSVFVVNRDLDGPREVEISLVPGRPGAEVEVHTITGPDPRRRQHLRRPRRGSPRPRGRCRSDAGPDVHARRCRPTPSPHSSSRL